MEKVAATPTTNWIVGTVIQTGAPFPSVPPSGDEPTSPGVIARCSRMRSHRPGRELASRDMTAKRSHRRGHACASRLVAEMRSHRPGRELASRDMTAKRSHRRGTRVVHGSGVSTDGNSAAVASAVAGEIARHVVTVTRAPRGEEQPACASHGA